MTLPGKAAGDPPAQSLDQTCSTRSQPDLGESLSWKNLPKDNELTRPRQRNRLEGSSTKDPSLDLESTIFCQNNSLVLLQAEDADTLVIIGRPPRQWNQSNVEYAPTAHHFSKAHKIRSENVFNLGSSKLKELFGPTAQFRTERRLKRQGIWRSGEPHNIKYLLDLRPPNEEDDAIFLITELTCSIGILTWFKMQQKYKIPRTMVYGQDDYVSLPARSENPKLKNELSGTGAEQCKNSVAASPPTKAETGSSNDNSEPRKGNWEGIFPAAPVVPGEMEDEVKNDDHDRNGCADRSGEKPLQQSSPLHKESEPIQEPVLQPEYDRVRHWSAIERLLHAIEGNDPMLDSAPKVWTFFAVANYFGCAGHGRVNKWITTWLFTPPNHNFIQCNPEACYRIGLGIRSEALTKVAFSLLVGEKAATDVEGRKTQGPSTPSFPAASRKFEAINDDEHNRIDHAADVFMKRSLLFYEELVGSDMSWLSKCPIFRSLDNFVAAPRREVQAADELKESIKRYVRARITWVLTLNHSIGGSESEQHAALVRPSLQRYQSDISRYNDRGEEGRILSRVFWMALGLQDFAQGDRSAFTPDLKHHYGLSTPMIPAQGWSLLATELHNEGNVCIIQKQALYASETKFKSTLKKRHRSTATDLTVSDMESPKMRRLGAELDTGTPFDTFVKSSALRTEHQQLSTSQRELALRPRIHLRGKGTSGLQEELKLDDDDHHDNDMIMLPSHEGGLSQDQSEASGSALPGKETESNPRLQISSQGSLIDRLLVQVTDLVQEMCDELLLPSHLFIDSHMIPTTGVESLVSLNDSEWKFLPLWAGGLDDGTGGVFEDADVPNDESGIFGGGTRGLGALGHNPFAGSSDWSEINSTMAGASREAMDGTATEMATVQSLSDVDMDVISVPASFEGSRDANNGAIGPVSDSMSALEDLDVDCPDARGSTEDEMSLSETEPAEAESSGWDDCDI